MTNSAPRNITPLPVLDVSQSYRDGAFWTRCSCGQEFRGIDPDDADAAAHEHCFPEDLTR